MSGRKIVLAAILVGGCSTAPKPNELEAFEKLKQSPNYQAAQRRAPEMVADAERLFGKSEEEWKKVRDVVDRCISQAELIRQKITAAKMTAYANDREAAVRTTRERIEKTKKALLDAQSTKKALEMTSK